MWFSYDNEDQTIFLFIKQGLFMEIIISIWTLIDYKRHRACFTHIITGLYNFFLDYFQNSYILTKV